MIGALPPACQPLLAEHHCADGQASPEGGDILRAVLVLDGQPASPFDQQGNE